MAPPPLVTGMEWRNNLYPQRLV
uniref:Uncharacterized protein n=1 Tax=Tetraselmis sp. GSL018 TaxID=582737 RepID=A0A061R0E1_9CHLO